MTLDKLLPDTETIDHGLEKSDRSANTKTLPTMRTWLVAGVADVAPSLCEMQVTGLGVGPATQPRWPTRNHRSWLTPQGSKRKEGVVRWRNHTKDVILATGGSVPSSTACRCIKVLKQPTIRKLWRRSEGWRVRSPTVLQSHKVTVGDLCDLRIRNMRQKGCASVEDDITRIELHIRPLLGHLRSGSVNGDTISQYVERRQASEEKPANATINRELACIKRAYNLGRQNNVVTIVPYIEMLPEDNVRQGFFREDHFRAVLKYAEPLLYDVLIVAFYTGWRIQSILNLEWDVQEPNVIRSKQTKNDMASVFPLDPFPELAAAIERRRQASRGMITPWVFHRKGKQVRSIKRAWQSARAKAELGFRIIHDFRRTAVRNLKKARWGDTEIMKMVGLKTLSMLIRYGITEEADILQRAKTMAAKKQND
jgi:integrase